MAYIIGAVSEDELDCLRAAGWEDEDAPVELQSEYDDTITRMFFVDSDVFTVMTGPGWEKEK